MKRIILAVLGVLTVSTGADAQNRAQTVERALLAAPARARDAATVIQWNANHTHQTIKEGESQLVCWDRSRDPGERAFATVCTALGNLDREAQNRRFAADGGDPDGTRALVAAAEENGTRIMSVFGSPWLTLEGDNQASARTHITIAMPGATEASTGFPENGSGGGAFIMAAGSSEAHLHTPYIVAP
jgi:hypothetical protein